jgi:hypothetical protein
VTVGPGAGDAGDVYVRYCDAGTGPPKLGQTSPHLARREDAFQRGIAGLGADGRELVGVAHTPECGGRLTSSLTRRGVDAG